MEFIKYFFLLICLWTNFNLNKIVVKSQAYCPQSCECDQFEGLNRADCRGQQLINANLEISEYVQILDLNENEITVLDNECFKKQIHITNLSIAYNAIHTIYLNAFSTLRKLNSIDLSHNRLEYINEKIFENNQQLIEVNLSGNKFMSFPNQALFISSSVQNLILQSSQITHIYPMVFSKLLNLQQLDLSENLMITLKMEPFNPLEKLSIVNLEDNRWICDKDIENLVKGLKVKNITVKLNMCHFELQKGNKNVMFEKMMVDPTLNIETISGNDNEKPQTIIESVWKILNNTENELDSCSSNNFLYVCNLYQECLQNLTLISKILENSPNEIQNIEKKEKDFFRLISDTYLIFYFGICIGAALVFVIVACTLCATKCCNRKNQKSDSEINDLVSADREFQYVHLERPSHVNCLAERPPPVPVRISSRRRRRRPPPPPLNRSISTPAQRNHQVGSVNDFASFVSRLFERPARHRYYQAFNDNTAHLIRRLSRSSLVNNRVSQHFLNETMRNRNERNNANQSVRSEEINPDLVDNENIQSELESFIQIPDDEGYSINNGPSEDIRGNPIEESYQPNTSRSETPPPSYKEVVKY